MPQNCFTLMSSPETIHMLIREADLVVGSVLIPGAKAPKLVTRDMLKIMKKGANVIRGQITFKGVADTFGMKLASVDTLL
jgi:alanine dehydrogenase